VRPRAARPALDRASRRHSPGRADGRRRSKPGRRRALRRCQLGGPFFDRAVDGLRSQGRLSLFAQALVMRAWSGIRLGDWDRAALDAEEGAFMARQTRQPSLTGRAIAAEAAIAGLRGYDSLAANLADGGERAAASARARAALFDLAVRPRPGGSRCWPSRRRICGLEMRRERGFELGRLWAASYASQ
jgi:hypothetical protein